MQDELAELVLLRIDAALARSAPPVPVPEPPPPATPPEQPVTPAIVPTAPEATTPPS